MNPKPPDMTPATEEAEDATKTKTAVREPTTLIPLAELSAKYGT